MIWIFREGLIMDELDKVYNKMLLEGFIDLYKRGFEDLNRMVDVDMDDRLRGRIYVDWFGFIKDKYVNIMEGKFKDNTDFINRLKETKGNRFIKDRFYNDREREIYDAVFYKNDGLKIKDKDNNIFVIIFDNASDKFKKINIKINDKKPDVIFNNIVNIINDDMFYQYIDNSDLDISIININDLDNELAMLYPNVRYRPRSWGEYHKY